jgi:nucleoside phosphorylase
MTGVTCGVQHDDQGGHDDDQNTDGVQHISDIVISDAIIPYTKGSSRSHGVKLGEPIPSASHPPASQTLLAWFRMADDWGYKSGKKPGKHYGPQLSGHQVINDLALKKALLEKCPDAKGIEVDGADVCAAADSQGLHWIVVKSICDWGDKRARDKKQSSAAFIESATIASEFVFHVLNSSYASMDLL